MKYTVDEEAKTISVEGNPSLFKFVEVMNKRFPNDEWKEYKLVLLEPDPFIIKPNVGGSGSTGIYPIKGITWYGDPTPWINNIKYPNDQSLYGDLANKEVHHSKVPPCKPQESMTWEQYLQTLRGNKSKA